MCGSDVYACFAAGCAVIVSAWLKKEHGLIRDVDVVSSWGFCEYDNACIAGYALFTFSLSPLRGWSCASTFFGEHFNLSFRRRCDP
jgi:hypothetical protein